MEDTNTIANYMTLEEFVSAVKDEAVEFYSMWLWRNKVDPEGYPLQMRTSDWWDVFREF